ncbi:MAG: hypothetical protein R2794_09360 [Chitinophagales bacterium]
MYRWILIGLVCMVTACDQEQPINLEAPQNKFILCKGSTLYLNNGEKWQANTETTQRIDDMIARTNAFADSSDLDAYHALANHLKEDYIYIFEHCTIMGNAHEMLHGYLYPLYELITPMQIGGETTCANQLTKLKEHLALYHTYFI